MDGTEALTESTANQQNLFTVEIRRDTRIDFLGRNEMKRKSISHTSSTLNPLRMPDNALWLLQGETTADFSNQHNRALVWRPTNSG